MSIYQLKPAFQNLLRPLVKRLEQRGITANQVTLFACGLSLILGAILTIFASISDCIYFLGDDDGILWGIRTSAW